jgi:Putative auto-transporter adhesin, head GIN domain
VADTDGASSGEMGRFRVRTLVVGTNGSFTTDLPMTVHVTVRTLDAVTLTGTGAVNVENVHADRLIVRLPGTGRLTMDGTAERLEVELSGSGDARLEDLVARDVAATLSGFGRLEVHATGSLDAALSGAGMIVYSGNPTTVTEHVTGTGAVTEAKP